MAEHPNSPLKPKSEKTVRFIGEDGQVLDVVTSISKGALSILRKQGYKKESEREKELEELALAKADAQENSEGRTDPENQNEEPQQEDNGQPGAKPGGANRKNRTSS